MNYLEQIGKNAKKAFEDLKDVKHKKIKKVLDNYNQSLKKNGLSVPLITMELFILIMEQLKLYQMVKAYSRLV